MFYCIQQAVEEVMVSSFLQASFNAGLDELVGAEVVAVAQRYSEAYHTEYGLAIKPSHLI